MLVKAGHGAGVVVVVGESGTVAAVDGAAVETVGGAIWTVVVGSDDPVGGDVSAGDKVVGAVSAATESGGSPSSTAALELTATQALIDKTAITLTARTACPATTPAFHCPIAGV